MRELAEELGLAQSDVRIAQEVAVISTGAVVDGIPKLDLLYRVDLRKDAIRLTDNIRDLAWFTAQEFRSFSHRP